ncbi:hypothetical protein AK830_g8498 [Neonectria ditissima]|uniref:Signal peptide-containing protein n=1 Tax=Neonectria ditissima TaxID=78410 RepID=A0A0P7AU84_9HYPO|nr:hypothetical protein AK830_g8498 [Neonectria ditissima]
MSFPIAFQSAVFYIVACTPCAKVRHRQKARVQAKKERQEKAKLEVDQPGLYQHPSPFNTNPYWQEEITMGPSLPKKSASKNSSQRGLTSSGGDSCALSMSEQTNVGGSRLNIAPSTTVVTEDEGLSDDWNRRRGYQREDEELWGQWSGQKFMEAISKARDSAGRLIESTLGIDNKEVTDEDRREFYFTPKNPPINDYHPPVVSSKIPSKNAHRWMLQPPPPAKIMEGKIPVSRAGSSGSKSSGKTLIGEDVQLGRLVHEKLVMEKLKKENSNPNSNPTETELIESLFMTRTNRSMSITRTRSLSFDASDDSMDNIRDKRMSRMRPVAAPPGAELSDDESDEPIPFSHSTMTLGQRATSSHAAQRPNLETILSTRSINSSRMSSKRTKKKSLRAKRLSGAASPVGDDTD